MRKEDQVKWNEKMGVAANARRQLPRLVAAYFARGRELLAEEPQPDKLHRLRLASKRLRYTLELFRPCYGPGLEARLDALRRIQSVLGDVNDGVAAGKMLAEAMNGKSPQSARIQRYLTELTEQKAREFRKDWSEVFDAPGQEEWWTGYLSRSARSPARKS